MARIPGGEQFGQVVARPGPMVSHSPEAYGAGVAREVTRAGAIGMDMAGREIAKDKAEADQVAREALAEQKQQAREQEAEAKHLANESKRVQALTATAKAQGGLAALHDQIGTELDTGALDKSAVGAAWTERSAKLMEDSLAGVDPQHRELVDASLLNDVGRYGQSVTKMVTQRDRKDIMAGGMSYFEEMQRFAARGPKEADQAIANVGTFWKTTGPMAGEDPAAASARVQMFAERVRTNQATSLVNADPAAALKALKNPNYLPELDPDKRTTLIHTADSMVVNNMRRAEIRANAAALAQKQAWDSVQTVFESGMTFTPERAAQLSSTFKGTPYDAAFKTMIADGPANTAFVSQPLPVQAAMLEQLQNKRAMGGTTEAETKQYERMKKMNDATLKAIKEDPYKAASEHGITVELKTLTLDKQTLPQQLAERAVQAHVVSTWTGEEESLLRPGEVDKVGTMLQAMTPKDRAETLGAMGKTMTPGQMRKFSAQLGAKDETLAAASYMAARGHMTTLGRPVAEISLLGADAMKEGRVKFGDGKSKVDVLADIDKITRGAFLTEAGQRAASDAALSVYAGLLSEGKNPSAKEAVNLATGGVMDINGAKIVKPFGWTDAQVKDTLRAPDTVTKMTGGKPAMRGPGGKPINPDEISTALRNGAQLGPSRRPGYYTVSIDDRIIVGEDGQPMLMPMGGK